MIGRRKSSPVSPGPVISAQAQAALEAAKRAQLEADELAERARKAREALNRTSRDEVVTLFLGLLTAQAPPTTEGS